jgi:hypothetical protein
MKSVGSYSIASGRAQIVTSAQQGVQWTGGYAARFLAFFVALSFSRFDSESRPTHLPLTRAVGRTAFL